MSGCAKHITVFAIFKNTRCATVVQNQEFFHFFRHRRYRQAVTRSHIADHGIHFFAVIQGAQLLHLFGGAAVLIHVNRLNLHATKTNLVVGGRCRTFIEGVHQHLGTVDGRHAKALCRLAREKTDDADFERLLRQRRQHGERNCRRNAGLAPAARWVMSCRRFC